MNVVLFLEEILQVLGVEAAGVAVCAVLLYGYVKMMSRHTAK
ncbi:MAG: hypothetical protein QM697_14270 [Lachnospiraceae bacterium]